MTRALVVNSRPYLDPLEGRVERGQRWQFESSPPKGKEDTPNGDGLATRVSSTNPRHTRVGVGTGDSDSPRERRKPKVEGGEKPILGFPTHQTAERALESEFEIQI